MTQDSAEAHTDALADTTPPPESAAPGGDISAREAIHRAVAELGPEAEIDDVLTYLRAKYGLCPPRVTAQSYLSLARKDARDGTSTETRRRGRPRKLAANYLCFPPPSPTLDDAIDAVEILRDLCDRLGDDDVCRLLDAL